MSPEQFSTTQEISYKSDIYSLGVVFYEMITGRRPFKNEYSAEVIQSIAMGKYIPVGKQVKKTPRIVKKIIRKSFNPNPEKRYKNLLPLIKMLRKYFKRYNLYELKASIACLVSNKTDCSQFPYYARHRELVKKRKRNVIASLIIAFLMCMAFAIWHADLHYTFFLSNYFGKVVVSFNQANLDPNSTLLRIDNKFQKVTFGKDKTYKKKMFLKKGFHEVSINSGSYKITRKITVLPYKQQQLSPTMRNGMEVPIRVYNLSPKEVMLSLRFWDALVPSKYLFQFDYYNELNEKLRKEKDNLIIWDSQRKKMCCS